MGVTRRYTLVHGFCFFRLFLMVGKELIQSQNVSNKIVILKINPIHPIGNRLRKQKPCTKIYRLVLKPPYKSHTLMGILRCSYRRYRMYTGTYMPAVPQTIKQTIKSRHRYRYRYYILPYIQQTEK